MKKLATTLKVIDRAHDIELAAQIIDAMRAIKEADADRKKAIEQADAARQKVVDAADATRKEKQTTAGKLLAIAYERHPKAKDFAKFLKLAGGIQLRRAQDLIAFARGSKEFEKHQADNAAAQKRHREKIAETRARSERLQAEARAVTKPEPQGEMKPATHYEGGDSNAPTIATVPIADAPTIATKSAKALREFEFACRTYLPKLNSSDLEKAGEFFRDLVTERVIARDFGEEEKPVDDAADAGTIAAARTPQ